MCLHTLLLNHSLLFNQLDVGAQRTCLNRHSNSTPLPLPWLACHNVENPIESGRIQTHNLSLSTSAPSGLHSACKKQVVTLQETSGWCYSTTPPHLLKKRGCKGREATICWWTRPRCIKLSFNSRCHRVYWSRARRLLAKPGFCVAHDPVLLSQLRPRCTCVPAASRTFCR